MTRFLAVFALLAITVATPVCAEGVLPRFASLRSGEANLRAGPGTRYPIHWVYHRRSMPVEIIDEYGNWRKIRDVDGTEGWLHHGLLSGLRTALIFGETRTLRRNPDLNSYPVLKAKPMVISKLLRCSRTWCYMEIGGYKGWMEKTAIWGVYADEKF